MSSIPFSGPRPHRAAFIPETDELIQLLRSATLVESGSVLNVPNVSTINSSNLVPKDHIKGWARISVDGKEVRISNVSEKTAKRRILKTIHPMLNLNAVRTKAAAEAMDQLYKKVESWKADGLKTADVPLLTKKAERLQARRDTSKRVEARRLAVEQIRSALMSPAGRGISQEELARIWEDCLVRGVMIQ